MTNSQNIQTVHGVTYPVFATPSTDAAEEPSIDLYREETAKRLEDNNQKATVVDRFRLIPQE